MWHTLQEELIAVAIKEFVARDGDGGERAGDAGAQQRCRQRRELHIC